MKQLLTLLRVGIFVGLIAGLYGSIAIGGDMNFTAKEALKTATEHRINGDTPRGIAIANEYLEAIKRHAENGYTNMPPLQSWSHVINFNSEDWESAIRILTGLGYSLFLNDNGTIESIYWDKSEYDRQLKLRAEVDE